MPPELMDRARTADNTPTDRDPQAAYRIAVHMLTLLPVEDEGVARARRDVIDRPLPARPVDRQPVRAQGNPQMCTSETVARADEGMG